MPRPPIAVPPPPFVPESVRPAIARYAADADGSRAELIAAVDQGGHAWEQAIASRAVEARIELVGVCRRLQALHDELVGLRAAAQWLDCFPGCSHWELEPFTLYVAGREIAVSEIIDVIEDTVDVDPRLARTAERSPELDPAYVAPARPDTALHALSEAGHRLSDIAELIPGGVSISTVSKWLSGDRLYRPVLVDVLEQLVGVETAKQILALIPRAHVATTDSTRA